MFTPNMFQRLRCARPSSATEAALLRAEVKRAADALESIAAILKDRRDAGRFTATGGPIDKAEMAVWPGDPMERFIVTSTGAIDAARIHPHPDEWRPIPATPDAMPGFLACLRMDRTGRLMLAGAVFALAAMLTTLVASAL